MVVQYSIPVHIVSDADLQGRMADVFSRPSRGKLPFLDHHRYTYLFFPASSGTTLFVRTRGAVLDASFCTCVNRTVFYLNLMTGAGVLRGASSRRTAPRIPVVNFGTRPRFLVLGQALPIATCALMVTLFSRLRKLACLLVHGLFLRAGASRASGGPFRRIVRRPFARTAHRDFSTSNASGTPAPFSFEA